MSCKDSCVCLRRFKSRIVLRMAFIAEELIAGLNPPNSELSRRRRTRTRPKAIPKKVKFDVRIFTFSLPVFAVDDLGLRRMHFQMALRQPGLKRNLEGFRF